MRRLLLPLAVFVVFAETKAQAYRADPTPQEMADLTRQIAAEPGNARPLQYRGLNYAVLGEKDKALADYKAAQKISPAQHYLYWSFGWALFDTRRPFRSGKTWLCKSELSPKSGMVGFSTP